MSEESISANDYLAFCNFLEENCGIALGDNKQYLVSSRLDKLMQANSIQSLAQLVESIKDNANSQLKIRVIDAMTTNETSWFRDTHPFEILKHEILPRCAKKKLTEIRIWSAACSSGQEPYSISMAIQEFLNTNSTPLSFIQIIATDLSPTKLNEARAGKYDGPSLTRGLSEERKQKFFTPVDSGGMELKQEIRERVVFKELNLLQNYTSMGKFDVIFIRNILIYLSKTNKSDILNRIADLLLPDGYLFLGSTETITSYSDRFESIRMQNGLVHRLK